MSATRTLYPYTRFSTGEQGEGNSAHRQNKPLEHFVRTHPEWVISTDDDFTDRGRSAMHGRHLGRGGGLARFLALIRAGVVRPGSGLAIENWDRLTRMKLSRSQDLAKEILRAGVAIVLVPTGEIFEPLCLDDPMTQTRLLWEFERAYRESARKAEYSLDNWEEKRKEITQRKIVTATRPFWLDIFQDGTPIGTGRGKLDLDKPCEYRLNSQADIVRMVFDLADLPNMGTSSIVSELAKKGIKFRRATPNIATVWRLLTNPAVIGTYTPYGLRDEKGRRPARGEPVEGYYPAVITPDQFARVAVRLRERKKKAAGPKGTAFTNLFTGILFEKETGTPMYVKKARGVPMYVSQAALRGLTNRTLEFPVAVFESAVLRACREMSPDVLTPATPAAEIVRRCEGDLLALTERIAREQKRYDDAKTVEEEEASTGNISRLIARKKELEKERDVAAAEMSNAPADQIEQLNRLNDLLAKTDKDELASVRNTIRAVVTTLVDRIEMYVQKRGKPRREKKRAWVLVRFKGGASRYIFVGGDGVVVTVRHEGEVPFRIVAGGGWE